MSYLDRPLFCLSVYFSFYLSFSFSFCFVHFLSMLLVCLSVFSFVTCVYLYFCFSCLSVFLFELRVFVLLVCLYFCSKLLCVYVCFNFCFTCLFVSTPLWSQAICLMNTTERKNVSKQPVGKSIFHISEKISEFSNIMNSFSAKLHGFLWWRIKWLRQQKKTVSRFQVKNNNLKEK